MTMELQVPLSLAQQGIWGSSLHRGGSSYNITVAMRVSFALDIKALRSALKALVARHEILRTNYPIVDGVPLQSVSSEGGFCLNESVVTGTAPDQVEREIATFVERISRTCIDLPGGEIFTAHLLTVDSASHVLVLATHHIAVDQHTLNETLLELEDIYLCHVENKPMPPSPELQYRDFARWEKERMRERGDYLCSYWQRKLPLVCENKPLPFDHEALPGAHKLEKYTFNISQKSKLDLQLVCRQAGASDFGGILALWAVTLMEFTGEKQIFIGVKSGVRRLRAFHKVLGCFVNTVVVRVTSPAGQTLGDLVRQAYADFLENLEHSELPYHHIANQIRDRLAFQGEDLVAAYLNYYSRKLIEPKSRLFHENIESNGGIVRNPLTLNVADRDTHLRCTIDFDGSLFDVSTIERIAALFVSAVEKATFIS